MSDFRLELHAGQRLVRALAPADKSILEILRGLAPEYLSAPCGGKGRCGKCTVTVTGPVRRLADGERLTLERESVPGCAFAPAGDIFVELAPKQSMSIPETADTAIPGGGAGLGLAVDIGSTTVAAALYELESGQRIGHLRRPNAQRPYGADVLSRLELSRNGQRGILERALQTQLADMGRQLLEAAGRSAKELHRCVFAGNTIMEHFAASLDAGGIARPPFEGESLFGTAMRPAGALAELLSSAELYLSPCVSGYVGGDITAGLMASGALEAEGLWIFVDVGTNGEIALGNKEGFLCCATAAGPAFEGAELACGMDAAPGAIHRVYAADGQLSCHVIGGGEAKGLCGSGVIDAAAAALRLKLIGRSGRISPAEKLPEKLRQHVKEYDGKRALELCPGVRLETGDIRNIQLAKSAIRAGIETLLKESGRESRDIDRIVVAGGFGSYIDPESAFQTGLLPRVAPERIHAVGNASLSGAGLALTDAGREKLSHMAEKCRYVDLSTSPVFTKHYIEELNF